MQPRESMKYVLFPFNWFIFWILSGHLCYAAGLFKFGPKNYAAGDNVDTTVNTVSPYIGTEDGSSDIINYEYYYEKLHFCRPERIVHQSESLGSIIFGDRIFNSPFEINMLQNKSCTVLCGRTIPNDDAKLIQELIQKRYVINWNIDNLPVATKQIRENQQKSNLVIGSPIGTMVNDQPALYNHLHIVVEYHSVTPDLHRVVGAYVYPASRKSNYVDGQPACADASETEPEFFSVLGDTNVVSTYSVTWKYSDTPWATRWDKYMQVEDVEIHWIFLTLSATIALTLVITVFVVLFRVLNRDITTYNNALLDQEYVEEDSGWKLIYADVFRPPKRVLLFSVVLGTGAQLFFMSSAIILLAILGLSSPSRRGSLSTAIVILFILSGFVSGYVSARAYKIMRGTLLKRNIVLTPFVVPGVFFCACCSLNVIFWFKNSSSTIPLKSLVTLVLLYLIFTVPLSFFGSIVGFRSREFVAPVRTNQIPRQIPDQSIWLRTLPSVLIGGAIPAATIFVELYSVMDSLWFHPLYFMFGFLFLCFGIMIATCSMVSILSCYFQLCSENYHWWWRSFFTSALLFLCL
ncbi:EMP70 family protein [Schizosaccharomyces japonicus yFS275]|uniref:Transmembrane 9 superfamily member n=1 Tax=Schizosaccharomyces japonicus (strain yFS275 / FY16936) TaxID=402676 RepID=B6JV92_SCHJY|nr:EMP70 family protein [Schizosaccharomyces japonicus yFS275]EEB05293.1 EMP70 family protein [Schizosaccharomyces japonicus yFS275]